MAFLKIEDVEYILSNEKLTTPALEVKDTNGSIVGYGFLSESQPSTKTLKVGEKFLNQPRLPYTETLEISITAESDLTSYSEYISVQDIYNATWAFVGTVSLTNENYTNWEGGNGFVKIGDITIAIVSGNASIDNSGVLVSDSESTSNLDARVTLESVKNYSEIDEANSDGDDHIVVRSSGTSLVGTLTITGFKL